MQMLPPQLPEPELDQQRLNLAENELEVARIFTEFSLRSYSMGKLQRATDAQSKAEAVCRRVAERLSASEINEPDADRIKSILVEVRGALTRLPTSIELHLRARGAGAA